VIESYLLKNKFVSVYGQTIKTSSFGVSDESYNLIFEILEGKFPEYQIEKNKFNREGEAEGILVGGNLALVYALLGTEYSFDFRDKILFLEDIGENFYALDRMLMSLELAGVFSEIKGLVIGGMTRMDDEKTNRNYMESFDDFAYKLISERVSKYDFPVIFGCPNGHIFDNHPLIIGAKIKIKTKNNIEIKNYKQ
jgi:muramoyltetrapeptide carboxypeptidase